MSAGRARWAKGAQQVRNMIDRGELDYVHPDSDLAGRTLLLA